LKRTYSMSVHCNVCAMRFESPIYESADERSITTMNKLVDGKTRVYFCPKCGHLQTNELPNVKKFYEQEYDINSDSEDQDQIYAVVDGKPVFRADHQAAVLMSKVSWFPGCAVLDYGCAKAPTLKKVLAQHPEIEAYLFDVTDRYVRFWQRFPKQAKWSVGIPDPSWKRSLDVVLSFYALEHVVDLHAAIANIKDLLKPGGLFYFIIPNVYANNADFIVADHVNHFSPSSISYLLSKNGFSSIDVDEKVHDAAFVVTARFTQEKRIENDAQANNSSVYERQATELSRYWSTLSQKIRAFEAGMKPSDVLGIYGAGFYGNLIASVVSKPKDIACFVDQNPHLQGTSISGKHVVSPASMAAKVTHIAVGLNPRKAKAIIEAISAWQNRKISYLYL